MQSIKMYGFPMLVAFIAMAFAGASSAMANGPTALCQKDESPCGGANMISHLHKTSKTKVKFLSEPTIECFILRLGDAVKNGEGNPLGNPLIFKLKTTFSNCNNSCQVEEREGPSEYRYLRTGPGTAAITLTETTYFHCFFGFIKCTVNSEGIEGQSLDSLTSSEENGSDSFPEQEMQIVSGGCPESVFLDLTTTPLTKTYIST